MLRMELFLCLGAMCLCAASSQPVLCSKESQCSAGYFCEPNAHTCRECLSCQDLQREPPITPSACIKSITDCGDCKKGWEKDSLGDVNSACVQSVPGGTTHYAWWPWLLGVGIFIFLALMVGIVIYVWMNPYIFENFKLRGNSNGGTVSTDIRAVTRASAPEAPPPYTPNYDVPYSSVRTTDSPCPPPPGDAAELHSEEEGPFLKTGWSARPNDARESSANQAATVYNLPNYERRDPPSSPEPPIVTEVTSNLPIFEEETMDSPWTPNGPSTADVNANLNEASGGSESLPALLAAAKDTSLVEHPEPKRIRLQQAISTNNRNRDSSNSTDDSSQGNFSGGQNGQAYNFITQITNVVKINRSS